MKETKGTGRALEANKKGEYRDSVRLIRSEQKSEITRSRPLTLHHAKERPKFPKTRYAIPGIGGWTPGTRIPHSSQDSYASTSSQGDVLSLHFNAHTLI